MKGKFKGGERWRRKSKDREGKEQMEKENEKIEKEEEKTEKDGIR